MPLGWILFSNAMTFIQVWIKCLNTLHFGVTVLTEIIIMIIISMSLLKSA